MPSWDQTPKGAMTAAVLSNPGHSHPSNCFAYSTDYPRPSLPSPDWVLCRVHAAGLNRAELRGRTGAPPFIAEFIIFQKEYHQEPPKILGEEFVGEVEEAAGATSFKRGQKVTGFVYGGGKAHDGAYAQYVICHSRRLYRLPDTKLPWNVLGAIPMSMFTAWGSLMYSARLGERGRGATVVIHGATSSVGLWGVLISKDKGAKVIATTRDAAKVERLKKAGADYVVLEKDIDTEIPKIAPDGVDIVQELVGPDQVMRCVKLCARGGTVVLVGPLNLVWKADDFQPFLIPPTRNVSFYTMTNSGLGSEDAGSDHESVEKVLDEVVRKVESGVFPPETWLDKTFQMADVGEAHHYMEEQDTRLREPVLEENPIQYQLGNIADNYAWFLTAYWFEKQFNWAVDLNTDKWVLYPPIRRRSLASISPRQSYPGENYQDGDPSGNDPSGDDSIDADTPDPTSQLALLNCNEPALGDTNPQCSYVGDDYNDYYQEYCVGGTNPSPGCTLSSECQDPVGNGVNPACTCIYNGEPTPLTDSLCQGFQDSAGNPPPAIGSSEIPP